VPRGQTDTGRYEDKLERLEGRLDRIESLLLSQQSQMDEVRSLFGFFRGSLRFYDEVSHLLSYISSFKRATKHEWIFKDEFAKDIILTLARKGPRNISQLTRDIREDRGTASRRIISERVDRLIESGIVRETKMGPSRKLELGSQDEEGGPRERPGSASSRT
jgi:DNA-binding transcriptional ArsR family regulator